MKESNRACCCPDEGPRSSGPTEHYDGSNAERRVPANAVLIPGGNTILGTRHAQIPDDGESPIRKTKVQAFVIASTTVTNAQFKEFIDATQYVTEAERFGWSYVFWDQVPEQLATQGVEGLTWWRKVDGANWHDVHGPGTHAEHWREDHPVVHMSHNDAQAYATWVGGRLPTEAEWEHAARGGLGDVKFPRGDKEPDDVEFLPCNIWQGKFPRENSGADGYTATAPAMSYELNAYGLYQMVGNVWQWTADNYRINSLKKHVKQRLTQMKGYKVSKGGSYLCHRSYCYRYRIAARSGTSPDSTTTHTGFRVVWSPE